MRRRRVRSAWYGCCDVVVVVDVAVEEGGAGAKLIDEVFDEIACRT